MTPNVAVTLTVSLLYTASHISIAALGGSGSGGPLLGSVMANGSGSYNLTFTPVGSVATVVVSSMVSFAGGTTVLMRVGGVSYSQQSGYTNVPQLVAVSSKGDDKYEFGFNGKYKDNEVAGIGNSINFGARMYNPRIVRFNSRDPLTHNSPNESPYIFAGNNPIQNVDIDGKYKQSAEFKRASHMLSLYLDKYIRNDVMKSPFLTEQLMKFGQFKTKEDLYKALTKNQGPSITVVDKSHIMGATGYYTGGENGQIQISKDLVNDLNNAKTDKDRKVSLLRVVITILHETTHYGDAQDGDINDNMKVTSKTVSTPEGNVESTRIPKGGFGDKGTFFEIDTYNEGDDKKGPVETKEDAGQVHDRESSTGNKKGLLPTLPIPTAR